MNRTQRRLTNSNRLYWSTVNPVAFRHFKCGVSHSNLYFDLHIAVHHIDYEIAFMTYAYTGNSWTKGGSEGTRTRKQRTHNDIY